jgi:hypothetical protein
VKSSEHNRDKNGRLITSEFSYPVVDKLDSITPYYRNKLLKICALPRNKRRIDTKEMNEILLLLCTNQYITLNVLANLVDRHPNSLRQRYIKTLVDQGDLRLAFPSTPNHQKQAYITNRHDQ